MADYRVTAAGGLLRVADQASIPDDPGNRDRVEYLAWVAAGNTADAYVPPVLTATETALRQLQTADAQMFRALEILIDVLLAKGTIVAADFPAPVRALYQARKAQRLAAGVG